MLEDTDLTTDEVVGDEPNPELEIQEEYDVEDLPEVEPEAQDPEVDLKTALQEAKHEALKAQQEFTSYRQQADSLIRMQSERLKTPRRAPQEVPDDDDPWAEPQQRQQAPVDNSGMKQELAALRAELNSFRSEGQQKALRTDIELATRAVNDKYQMPLLDEENIIYEMQKHNGEMSAQQAAERVARRKLGAWKESGIRRVRPKHRDAPDVPPNVRKMRDYTEALDPAGTRDDMEAQMEAYENKLREFDV